MSAVASVGKIFTPALADVLRERIRQDEKWGEQNHDPLAWVAILTEEVGEASKEAVNACLPFPESGARPLGFVEERLQAFRTEMVQTAAVALQIVEAMDRDKWRAKKAADFEASLADLATAPRDSQSPRLPFPLETFNFADVSSMEAAVEVAKEIRVGNSPVTFLVVGPSGCGKTELVRTLMFLKFGVSLAPSSGRQCRKTLEEGISRGFVWLDDLSMITAGFLPDLKFFATAGMLHYRKLGTTQAAAEFNRMVIALSGTERIARASEIKRWFKVIRLAARAEG